jgi:hypothetical protein
MVWVQVHFPATRWAAACDYEQGSRGGGLRTADCGMRYAVCGMRYAVCDMRYAGSGAPDVFCWAHGRGDLGDYVIGMHRLGHGAK